MGSAEVQQIKRTGGESGILTWRFYTSLVFSNIPLKQCKIKGSMCFTMGRILTIGTFMEQISDVYRHHRHQRISSVAAPVRLSCTVITFVAAESKKHGMSLFCRTGMHYPQEMLSGDHGTARLAYDKHS